jgi:hypothetical protein
MLMPSVSHEFGAANDDPSFGSAGVRMTIWKDIPARVISAVKRAAAANPIAASAIVAAATANIAAMAAAIYDVTGLGAVVAILSAVTIITIQLGLISLTISSSGVLRMAWSAFAAAAVVVNCCITGGGVLLLAGVNQAIGSQRFERANFETVGKIGEAAEAADRLFATMTALETASTSASDVETSVGGSCEGVNSPPGPGDINAYRLNGAAESKQLAAVARSVADRLTASNRSIRTAIANYLPESHSNSAQVIETAIASARQAANEPTLTAMLPSLQRRLAVAEGRSTPGSLNPGIFIRCPDSREAAALRSVLAAPKIEIPRSITPAKPDHGNLILSVFLRLTLQDTDPAYNLGFAGIIPDLLLSLSWATLRASQRKRRRLLPAFAESLDIHEANGDDWLLLSGILRDAANDAALADLDQIYVRVPHRLIGAREYLVIPIGPVHEAMRHFAEQLAMIGGFAIYAGQGPISTLLKGDAVANVPVDTVADIYVLESGSWSALRADARRSAAMRASTRGDFAEAAE